MMNGNPPDLGQPLPATYCVDPQLDPLVRQVLGITLRGLFVSIQGFPPERVVASVARQLGNILSGHMQGDLGPVLQARARVKEAFHDGMAAVKPMPMQGITRQ